MPESLLNHRFKLGTYAGIPLFVHWTFSLAIGLVAYRSVQGGAAEVAFSIAQLLGVFLCVTLHEYGHALAARRYGIATADITLLPIGGVARLRKMPRIPWQEFVVAVAGPAVNVVIAAILAVALAILVDPALLRAIGVYAQVAVEPMTPETSDMMNELFSSPSWIGYGVLLLVVNMMLVLFNMIPAFPMDGGRVFRSLMAMVISYQKATKIASRVGVVIAIFMAWFALQNGLFFLLFICVFIVYSGLGEARQVDLIEAVRGKTVGDVMTHQSVSFPMNTTLGEIQSRWASISQTSVPVTSITGTVVGVISLNDLAAELKQNADSTITAGQLVDHRNRFGPLRADQQLEDAVVTIGKHHRQIPVVDELGQLVGVLDLDTMVQRGVLVPSKPVETHFDAST